MEVCIADGLIVSLRKFIHVIVSFDLRSLVERIDRLALCLHLSIEVFKLLIVIGDELLLRLNLLLDLLLLFLGSFALL